MTKQGTWMLLNVELCPWLILGELHGDCWTKNGMSVISRYNWTWYTHLKYFLLNAWNFYQRRNNLFHTHEDNLVTFSPPTQTCGNRHFSFLHNPKQGTHRGLPILGLPILITFNQSLTRSTTAALSFLLLQFVHTHQISDRSDNRQPAPWAHPPQHSLPPLWDWLSVFVAVSPLLPWGLS